MVWPPFGLVKFIVLPVTTFVVVVDGAETIKFPEIFIVPGWKVVLAIPAFVFEIVRFLYVPVTTVCPIEPEGIP